MGLRAFKAIDECPKRGDALGVTAMNGVRFDWQPQEGHLDHACASVRARRGEGKVSCIGFQRSDMAKARYREAALPRGN